MTRLTARIRATVPSDVKSQWAVEAAARGMSLSAFLRDATLDFLAARELGVTGAEIEFRSTGATLQ